METGAVKGMPDQNQKEAEGIEADDIREEITDQIYDTTDAAEIAIAAVDELADCATELDVIKVELQTTKEQLLRQAAEYQNYRRRTEQEKSMLIEFGKSLVVNQLLDVLDDFDRSLGATMQAEQQGGEQGPAYVALKQGVEMVYRKFIDELKKLGVEPIEAIGQPFNEDDHEAVMQQAAPDGVAEGTILHEVQKGYRLGDRVLRHSKVVVAS